MKSKLLIAVLSLTFVFSALAQRDRFEDRRFDDRRDDRIVWEIQNKVDQLSYMLRSDAIRMTDGREKMMISQSLETALQILSAAQARSYPRPPMPGPGPMPFPHH